MPLCRSCGHRDKRGCCRVQKRAGNQEVRTCCECKSSVSSGSPPPYSWNLGSEGHSRASSSSSSLLGHEDRSSSRGLSRSGSCSASLPKSTSNASDTRKSVSTRSRGQSSDDQQHDHEPQISLGDEETELERRGFSVGVGSAAEEEPPRWNLNKGKRRAESSLPEAKKQRFTRHDEAFSFIGAHFGEKFLVPKIKSEAEVRRQRLARHKNLGARATTEAQNLPDISHYLSELRLELSELEFELSERHKIIVRLRTQVHKLETELQSPFTRSEDALSSTRANLASKEWHYGYLQGVQNELTAKLLGQGAAVLGWSQEPNQDHSADGSSNSTITQQTALTSTKNQKLDKDLIDSTGKTKSKKSIDPQDTPEPSEPRAANRGTPALEQGGEKDTESTSTNPVRSPSAAAQTGAEEWYSYGSPDPSRLQSNPRVRTMMWIIDQTIAQPHVRVERGFGPFEIRQMQIDGEAEPVDTEDLDNRNWEDSSYVGADLGSTRSLSASSVSTLV